MVVLAVQALLSLRLVRADTAFQDEALYLWAGHLEWAHVLHGTPLPQFPAYFSGAPVIYPPLGALADSLGGLTAARVLSLVFMLGATTVLWSTTARLFGRRAAFFAAALFAVLGPTLHLGVVRHLRRHVGVPVALAAWFVVRAGDRQDATGWMLAAGVTLALANATSYPSALFDPVVILLALVIAFPKPGGKLAAGRVLVLLAITACWSRGAAPRRKPLHARGRTTCTCRRHRLAAHVLADSWSWTGVIVIAAVCGAVASWVTQPRTSQTWLLTLLAAAALLVPAEQASIHTTASLNKHVAFGAWFAAIAAGYAVDRLLAAVARRQHARCHRRSLRGRAFLSRFRWAPANRGSSPPAGRTPLPSLRFSGRWPITAPGTCWWKIPQSRSTTCRPVASGSAGRARGTSSCRRDPTGGPSAKAGIVGAGNAGTFAMYIRQGYFSFIALNFADTTSLDKSIAADIHRNHHYHSDPGRALWLRSSRPALGEYVIWQYEPQS